jgi:hypothetical protein
MAHSFPFEGRTFEQTASDVCAQNWRTLNTNVYATAVLLSKQCAKPSPVGTAWRNCNQATIDRHLATHTAGFDQRFFLREWLPANGYAERGRHFPSTGAGGDGVFRKVDAVDNLIDAIVINGFIVPSQSRNNRQDSTIWLLGLNHVCRCKALGCTC